MNTSIETLKTKGSVSVLLTPELKEAITAAMKAWREFCDLSEEIRAGFPYEKGVGFELKKKEGKSLDLKEDFHFTRQDKDWLLSQAVQHGGRVAAQMISDAQEVIRWAHPLVISFARKMEKEYGLDGFAEEVDFGHKNYFLRFIHYFGDRKPGDEIATSHTDKSGFTLHLYESAPGLQFLGYDGVWMDAPVNGDQTIIISGMQTQYRSQNALKALCHRVAATEETAKTGRYSMVCFIPLKKTAVYNKKGEGRLQEFEAGFNYSMSFGEFSKFFIKN